MSTAAPGAEEAGRLGPQGLGEGMALGHLGFTIRGSRTMGEKSLVLSPEFPVIHYTSPKK